MKRFLKTINVKKLRKVASLRSKADWILVGCVGAVLLVISLVVAHITPYESHTTQAFYQSETQNSTTYQRAELLTTPSDGAAQGKLLDGEGKNQTVELEGISTAQSIKLSKGDIIIVSKNAIAEAKNVYYYTDRLRVPGVVVVTILFVAIVALTGGRRGILSICGLFVSLIVIGWMIIPLIIQGYSPFWISLLGAYVIAIASVLISHGMRRRTYISIACICVVLTLVALLTTFAMWLTAISGIADEAAYYLSIGMENIDIRGIVAGGMIIATLGVLDDVVTTQVATVEELHKTNKRQSKSKLFLAASSVGSEHIASIVNTLALAYAGASLPFVILTAHQASSLFMIFNSEYVTVEVVRTLVASIGLVVAVPVSTLVAVYIYKRLLK